MSQKKPPDHHDTTTHDARLGRIIDELLDQQTAGDPLSENTIRARFPEDAADILDALRVAGQLQSSQEQIRRLIDAGLLRAADDGEALAELGPFHILGLLGRGGMGVVLKAFDPSLGRVVALKILRPDLATDPTAVARFQRETRAAARLEHPNIVRAYDVGEDRDTHYFVMEFVSGASLADTMRQRGPLPSDEIRTIFAQMLRALDAAGTAGIIHRDIKPTNVLIDDRDGQAKLADFGLARIASSQTRVTTDQSVFGTPEYMSPEQARGESDIDHRADLYAAGIVLYEMLTGRLPFASDAPSAVIHKILHEQPTPPRSVVASADRHLADLALRLMAKRPEHRFQSAAEALATLEQGGSVASPETRNRWRRRAVGATAVVASVGVIASLAGFATRRAMTLVPNSPPLVTAVMVDKVGGMKLNKILARYGTNAEWRQFYEFTNDDGFVEDASLVNPGPGQTPFILAARSRAGASGALIALSMDREQLWTVDASDDHLWPDCDAIRPWGCKAIAIADFDGRPGDEVIVICQDDRNYPTRVSILDPRTRTFIWDHWHLGQLSGLRILRDFFGQGRHGIAAWGLNNKLDGFDDAVRPRDRHYSRWDMTPVVMILDPSAPSGVGPPATDRITHAKYVAPFAYVYLELAHCRTVKRIRYDSTTGTRRLESISDSRSLHEFGRIDDIIPLQHWAPTSDAVFEVTMTGVDANNRSVARAGLYTTRTLDLVAVLPNNTGGETVGNTIEYWRDRWHVLVREGRDAME